MTIPFRFGVVSAQQPHGSSWTHHARRVERLGYDVLLMPDNVSHGLAVFPALAAAATATSRLRVGSYVLANDTRHPVQVAKEALALAVLSGGRFELGLGAGRPDSGRDNAMLGLRFDDPGVRVSRLIDSVSIIKRLVAGGTVDHESPYYSITGASIVPRGIEPPDVRFLLAASAPRMITHAAHEADIIALGVPPETTEAAVQDRVELLRTQADGRPIEVNVNLMAIGDVVPRYLAGRIDTEALAKAGAISVVAGGPAEIADQLRERRERIGINYVVVGDELMDAFAPVVQLLTGS